MKRIVLTAVATVALVLFWGSFFHIMGGAQPIDYAVGSMFFLCASGNGSALAMDAVMPASGPTAILWTLFTHPATSGTMTRVAIDLFFLSTFVMAAVSVIQTFKKLRVAI